MEFLKRITVMDEENFVQWSRDKNSENEYYLFFHDEKVDSPVLSQLVKQFQIEFSVKGGGIQSVQGKKVGVLAVDFAGCRDRMDSIISFLNENGVKIEKK